jgi:hypothetical protein
MFLLHQSLWWVLLSGAIGYFCGWGKGRAGAGLLLGLLLGPFGCLAIMLLPPAPRRRATQGGGPGPDPVGGPACPRCRRRVSPSVRACPHCGNVLMRIRYAVE